MPRYSRLNPRKTNRERNPVSVTLTCGHTIRLKLPPLNAGSTFVCSQNTGCGYSLGWVFALNEVTSFEYRNPKYQNS